MSTIVPPTGGLQVGPDPYYSDDLVTLYHGDCRDLLPQTADVCITDPPYAVRWTSAACLYCGNDDPCDRYAACSDCLDAGQDSGHRATEMLGFISPNWSEKATHSRGYADHDPEAFAALLEVAWAGVAASLPAGGQVAAFCGNRTFAEMVVAAESCGFAVLDILAFVTNTGVAKSTTTLRPGHELAALMRLPGPVRHINPDWKAANTFALDKSRKSESSHLTTKPLSWMHALVRLLSSPSDVVLDPFAGSGSTLRAAKDLGRRAIGIEQSEAYCEVAANRLAQDTLFGGAA